MNSGDLSLSGKRIIVTRAGDQCEEIVANLKSKGATVLKLPMIKIIPAVLSTENEKRISEYYNYDVMIFTSANSVRNLFQRIVVRDQFNKVRIVAIGKKTSEALLKFGVKPDSIPGKSTSEELMKSLANFDWGRKRVLIPVGNLSNREITAVIESNGGIVDQIVVYETMLNDSFDYTMKEEVRSGQFDMVIFYSPSQVKNFVNIFGVEILKSKKIATIGPTTKNAVERFGLDVEIVPDNSTTEDLIASLVEHERI